MFGGSHARPGDASAHKESPSPRFTLGGGGGGGSPARSRSPAVVPSLPVEETGTEARASPAKTAPLGEQGEEAIIGGGNNPLTKGYGQDDTSSGE